MMENVAYLIKESGMGFNEVIDLPYAVFLSLLKHFRIFNIKQDPEGRKILAKSKCLYETEADLGRIRELKGYQQK